MMHACKGRGCASANTCYRVQFPVGNVVEFVRFEDSLQEGDVRCSEHIPDTKYLFREMEVEVYA